MTKTMPGISADRRFWVGTVSREHVLMNPQAVGLTDQEIADVSAWFGARPSQLRDLTTLP